MRARDAVVAAVLAGLLGFALTHRLKVGAAHVAHERLAAPDGAAPSPRYAFDIQPSRITATFATDGYALPMDLELVVDGEAQPLSLSDLESVADGEGKSTLQGNFQVDVAGDATSGSVLFRIDSARDVLVAELSAADPVFATAHGLALAVELGGEIRPVFVSGVGEISDAAHVSGQVAVLEDDAHPFGIVSALGPLDVRRHPTHGPDDLHGDGPMDLVVASPPAAAGKTDLRIALAPSTAETWRTLFSQGDVPTANVHGVVTGSHGARAHVFGLDETGAPVLRVPVGDDGRFTVDVPRTVTKWYAAESVDRTSAPTVFAPGTPWDLRLDLSPGGELRVRIIDKDTGAPITARLIVHGIDGTLDPSFGPDYRASGAGPIVDALRGEVVTPLPAGRYKVEATKGIAYTIDAKTIELAGDRTVSLELRLRHAVPTPGVLGCDLHVHARPSFDTPVSVEDRVLSLVAAGVDFAVPSEHNVVGNYTPALDDLDLSHEMGSVPGVEITTFNPYIGHFGLFPYPLTATVPPFRHTNIDAIFNAARHGDPNRILQVNHPRLSHEIGYFDHVGFDPRASHPPHGMRTDFDSIEVYNGYEMQSQDRVDAVLRDYFSLLNQGHHLAATGSSDSHSIQYQWAGYPRTMVSVGPAAEGDRAALEPLLVVTNLKRGHAIVTSGPIVEVDAQGAHPGDEVTVGPDASVTAHIRVRAAPWVDVSSLEIVVDGVTTSRIEIPSQPTRIGDESGTIAEVTARMVRFESDVPIPIHDLSTSSPVSVGAAPARNVGASPSTTRRHWFMVIVRGTRKMDDVLPFMPVAPMAITNPIWYQTSAIGSDNASSKPLRGGTTH